MFLERAILILALHVPAVLQREDVPLIIVNSLYMVPKTAIVPNKVALSMILTVMFIAAGYLVWSYIATPGTLPDITQFEKEANESVRLLNNNQYNEAVATTETTLKLAQTSEETRTAEFLHARALLGRNEAGDLEKSIALFKTIAADENTTPQRRAGAMVFLASLFFKDQERQMIRNNVFNSEPYAGYLRELADDTDLATIKILEKANVIFPTPFAYHDIATIYRLRIHKQGIQPGNHEQISMAKEIKAAVTAMDALSATSEATSEDTLSARQVSKALSLGTASYLIPDEISHQMVNEAYEKSLEILRVKPTESTHYAMTALTYTTSLQARQPEEMSVRINELLSEIAVLGMNDSSIRAAFLEAKESPFTAKQLPYLLSRNADFARFVDYSESNTIDISPL